MTTKKPQKKRDTPMQKPAPVPIVSLRQKVSNFLVLIAGNILMMVMATLAIYNYDNPAPIVHVCTSSLPSFPLALPSANIFGYLKLPLPYPLSEVPPMFTNPTFYLVLAAVVLYLSALSSFPTPPNEDVYQPYILGAAVAGACVWIGYWEGALGGADYWVKIRRVVPVAGLVGLVGSLVGHKIGRVLDKGRPRGAIKMK